MSLDRPFDAKATLSGLCTGGRDPTTRLRRVAGGWSFERASRTPEGPASLQLVIGDGEVRARAWGDGGSWMLDAVPGLLGEHDHPEDFQPASRFFWDLHRRNEGARLPHYPRVVEQLVPTVLQQLVTFQEAQRGFALLVRRHGEPAPGPLELWLQPSARTLTRMALAAFTPLGILLKQAKAVQAVAARASRMEEAARMDDDACARRLMALPGIGPWTAGTVMLRGLGHADAVPIGDYHLPNQVAWVLARQPRADDRRMLELLEPLRPHRGRAVMLLMRSGISAPAYGPRMPIRPLPTP